MVTAEQDERARGADIAVIGGGPTGLTVALLLAVQKYRVALIAPDGGDDGRSVALLESSLAILDRVGLRSAVEAAGSPLKIMRLVDDTGGLVRAPEIAFKASEIGYDAFGASIPTAVLTRVLRDAAAAIDGIQLIEEEAAEINPGPGPDDPVTITTGSGQRIHAALAVGADGKHSKAREATGLHLKSWTYRQTALVTTLTHSRPHDGISTEFHTRAGPFTVVPVGDFRSGLVWVDRPDVIDAWLDADRLALAREIERRSHHILGSVEVMDTPRSFPMAGGYLSEPAARRIALVGEAAHFFPPIGAQGLNLGFRDCADLANAVGRGNPDPGSRVTLERYISARRLDVAGRTFGVDLLNRSLLIDFFPLQMARAATLAMADTMRPFRSILMRAGMSVSPFGRG